MAKRLQQTAPYNTAIELYIPTYTTAKGVPVKAFPAQGARLNCSFKTYGGTRRSEEKDANGVIVIEDTAIVETWYRPDITAECRIKVLQTGKIYEIINAPENIEMRNQFCKFMVRSIEGNV